MRTVALTVHNVEKLELFVEKRKNGFEVWIVGPWRGYRTVLDHHLTHDNLEAHLEYSSRKDLIWSASVDSEIPLKKHPNAIETETTITQGTYWDYEKLNLSVASHLSAIALLSADKKEWQEERKAIIGRWTDGVVVLCIEPGGKLLWSCSDPQHLLNVGERVHGHAPDSWKFAMWEIAIMNKKHKCGTHVAVLRLDQVELHLLLSAHPYRIAHVFRRG